MERATRDAARTATREARNATGTASAATQAAERATQDAVRTATAEAKGTEQAISAETRTAERTATSEAEATADTMAEATSDAQATQVYATLELEMTAEAQAEAAVTPEPPPAATATVDSAVAEYEAALAEIFEAYSFASTSLTDSLGEVGDDPAVIFDEAWKTDFTIGLGMMLFAANQTDALAPPNAYRELHNELRIAARHARQMVDLYERGINEIDPSLIARGGARAELLAESLERAGTLTP